MILTQTVEDYMKEFYGEADLMLNKFGYRVLKKDVLEAMLKQIKIDAYNQALEDAAENAVAKEDPDDCGTGDIWVDKNSILKLKK